MNKKQKEGLLELADFLETLPEANFDMDYFYPYTVGEGGSHEHRDCSQLLYPETEVKCGTLCDVTGWAAILNRGTWPKHMDGKLTIDDASFQKFFGLDGSNTDRICFSRFVLPKKERKALGLDSGKEFTSKIKAKQIRRIVEES